MVTGCKPRPVTDRFWEKVNKRSSDECWPWLAMRDRHGYGHMKIGSYSDGSRRRVIASRLSYEINIAPIPDGLSVCHKCDNPSCVNPSHLFLGTAQDNLLDASQKGRLRQPDPNRTHCKNGHELVPDNVAMQGEYRACRICLRSAQRRFYLKSKGIENA